MSITSSCSSNALRPVTRASHPGHLNVPAAAHIVISQEKSLAGEPTDRHRLLTSKIAATVNFTLNEQQDLSERLFGILDVVRITHHDSRLDSSGIRFVGLQPISFNKEVYHNLSLGCYNASGYA